MSTISSDEIISILKEEIENYDEICKDQEVGTVISVGDGIASIYGIDHAMYGEIVTLENGLKGMVQDRNSVRQLPERWLPNHSSFSRMNRQERWTLGLPKHCLISLPVSMRTDRRSSWLHIVCVRQAQRKECFSSRMERCFISYIVEI